MFGASLGQREFTKSTWSAPLVGVVTTAQFTWATIQGLGDLVYNLASGVVMQFSTDSDTRQAASDNLQTVGDNFSGPIGILGTIFPSAQEAGVIQLTMLTAIIAISLAVMNVSAYSSFGWWQMGYLCDIQIRKKTISKEREEMIQTIGFIVLMALVVLVTISDVAKIF